MVKSSGCIYKEMKIVSINFLIWEAKCNKKLQEKFFSENFANKKQKCCVLTMNIFFLYQNGLHTMIS